MVANFEIAIKFAIVKIAMPSWQGGLMKFE